MDYMKKIAGVFVAFAFLSFIITACSEDDNGGGTGPGISPVGNWVWVKTDWPDTLGVVHTTYADENTMAAMAVNNDSNSSVVLIRYYYGQEYNFTGTWDANRKIINIENKEKTYSASSNKLILTFDTPFGVQEREEWNKLAN